MDFAKKQLEKFGWVEGQGLGREKNGIANPIKVKIKRDVGGVGLAPGDEFNHWWSDVFNKAAQNIAVITDNDGVCIERKAGDDSSFSISRRHYGNHRKKLLYGGFLDSSCTYDEGTTSVSKETGNDCPNVCEQADDVVSDGIVNSNCHTTSKSLTDEELLRACGGRTAHKAARHGLTLNGKLKRIQEQELEVKQNDGTDQDKVEFRDRIRNRKRKRNKDSNSSVRKRTKE